MYYLITKYPAILLMFLIFSTADAQINPVYKIMKERGWIRYRGNDKTELIEQANKDVPICLGYNDTVENGKAITRDESKDLRDNERSKMLR